MRYIFCYHIFVLFCNPKTQTRKGLILYNTANGITSLKKHVKVNYFIIAKMFENEMNNPLKGELEKTTCKKRSNLAGSAIINVFATKDPLPKYHMQQKLFFEDMGLLIV
jgi:hypothetical protein